jgi:hypothetical protein
MELEPTSYFSYTPQDCAQLSFILVEGAQFFLSCLVGGGDAISGRNGMGSLFKSSYTETGMA